MRARTIYRAILVAIILIGTRDVCLSQDSTSAYNKVYNLPDRFFGSVHDKSEKLQNRVNKSTERYLNKLARRELKMQRKLAKTDSTAAKEIFGNVNLRYDSLKAGLHNNMSHPQVYSPRIDSMKTVLKFFDQNKVLSQSPEMQNKLKGVMSSYGDAQGKLDQSNFIESQLKERQDYLNNKLQNFPVAKELQKYKEQVYYYRSQMDQYKKIFEDPAKLEGTLLQVANKIPAFNTFFAKNSQLGQIFRLQGNDDISAADMNGLQTRDAIMQQMGTQIGSGAGMTQEMNSSMATAQSSLSSLKNKINQSGSSGGSESDMPNFRANEQKTRSFLKRLEFGTNMQSAKSDYFFPTTTDIGLSVGYKFTSTAVAGVGASYKLGLGNGWKHISLTHEGVGLRTFTDIKLKGSFWISGGWEFNYRTAFKKVEELKSFNAWQQSALLGVSKKIKLKSKTASLQVMYDLLAYRQVPTAQPLVFRTGYTFK